MSNTQPTGSKPEMSYKDSTWHLVKAAQRAREAAAARGGDPTNPDHLMVTGIKLGMGVEVLPLSLATVWALEKVESPYVLGGAQRVSMKDVAVAVVCFIAPVEVFNLAKRGEHEKIETMALEAAELLAGDTLAQVQRFMEDEFAKQRGDDGEEGESGKSKKGRKQTPQGSPQPESTPTAGS